MAAAHDAEDPYRAGEPTLRALAVASPAPPACVAFDRALVQRAGRWWWHLVLATTLAVGLLTATGGLAPWIAVVVVLLAAGLVRWPVPVDRDHILVVGDGVYTDELAHLPGTVVLMPLPFAARRFAIVWQPAPLPLSGAQALSVRLRVDLRVIRELVAANAATRQLSRWQRRRRQLAADLRRCALGPLREGLNRCGIDVALRPEIVADAVRADLRRVFESWGLALVELDVQALELVTMCDGPDRVWVQHRA